MSDPLSGDTALAVVAERATSLGGSQVVESGDRDGPASLAVLVEALGGPASTGIAVEAVREGFLCHHAPDSSRTLVLDDADLALLVGDLLYAIGLRELAEHGERDSVSILADLIRMVSERVEEGERRAVEALWLGQTVALAVGSDDAHRAALDALDRGGDASADRLLAWSRAVAEERGAGEAFSEVAEALQ
jgi:hypothetical protein